MKLRERLLALLHSPDYVPADLNDLARELGLQKRERKNLVHEARLLLGGGQAVWVKGDKLALRGEEDTVRGRIQFRSGGSALVIPEDNPEAALFITADDTDVALHGDRVVARVYADSRPGRGHGRNEARGRVTRVIERARTTVVGHLQRVRDRHYVTPDDPRIVHDVLVNPPATSGLDPQPVPGDKVVVALKDWTSRLRPLEGTLSERLGKTFEPLAELKGVYRKFGLETTFPAKVDQEASELPDHVRPSELLGRIDFREIPTFTIDPDDAKDFDDALSIEMLEGGVTRIGIHIADVSAYVTPGTVLDREAMRRGNSTYLVGTVVPMLPERLSNGLCSLVEAQDRLCVATILTFDKKHRVQQTEFARTVIRSRKRLTYKQAYALLFEHDLEKIRALPLPAKHQTGSTGRALSSLSDLELVDLQSALRRLWSIASDLRRSRMENGSLDLDMPEVKVYVDEQGYADRLEKVEHDESHQLIEEFMLAANEAVAHLTRTEKLPSLYRVHDEPDEEKLAEFRNLLTTFEVQIGELTERKEMLHLLDLLARHPQGHHLRSQLLRSLRKAAYRASPDGHYGLAKRDYTHFTSPIRRYSDLVVHRVLTAHLARLAGTGSDAPYSQGQLDGIGEHLTRTEVNSAEAERESVKTKLLEFFERETLKPRKTRFPAIITEVRSNGLFIELLESLTFGYLPVENIEGERFTLNPSGSAFVGRESRLVYGVGSRLEVTVEKVDRFKRQIDFRAPMPMEGKQRPAKGQKR
ncbi:ribonuclease R family protein [Nibricoccus sp. IMCC34717]|uniref:ribonuclease R family protein n=1 Tax=Nibricoccus sp. IMCC34717 TaxID=3034021 RepID=UPI0038511DE1